MSVQRYTVFPAVDAEGVITRVQIDSDTPHAVYVDGKRVAIIDKAFAPAREVLARRLTYAYDFPKAGFDAAKLDYIALEPPIGEEVAPDLTVSVTYDKGDGVTRCTRSILKAQSVPLEWA